MIQRLEALVLRRALRLPAPMQRLIGARPDADPAVAMLVRLQRWRGVSGLTAGTVTRTRRRIRRVAALTAGTPTEVGAVRAVTVAGRLPGRCYLPRTAVPRRPPAGPDASGAPPHATPPPEGGEPAGDGAPAGGDPVVGGGPTSGGAVGSGLGGDGGTVLVYFHGGGFVAGDLDTHDEVCRLLCAAAGLRVVSVAYSLAPEAPFPAAVHDAADAVRWAFGAVAGRGRVAVGGDSAGGNLAAVVCQELRARGGPMPAAQLLFYPLADHVGEWPSRRAFRGGPVLTGRDLALFRRCYLPGGVLPDPRHSPLLAPDLGGLPPAVVVTAALDPLRDEGEAYADALRAAGVPVVSRRVPGMVHAFVNLTSVSAPARRAVVEAAEALRAHLSR